MTQLLSNGTTRDAYSEMLLAEYDTAYSTGGVQMYDYHTGEPAVYNNVTGGAYAYDSRGVTQEDKVNNLIDTLDLVFNAGELKRRYGTAEGTPRDAIFDAVMKTVEAGGSGYKILIPAVYLTLNSPIAQTQLECPRSLSQLL